MSSCRAPLPRALLAAAALLAIAAASPSLARADDSAAADALFAEARVLLEKKRYAEACPKLEASYNLDKAVGTLMNLADCHENIGRVASAWAEWGEAFDWLKRDGDKRSAYASGRRDALVSRLPKLTISVSGATTGLQVYRGSTKVEEGAYNVTLPVDPGPHVLTVRRGDEVLKEERVAVAEAESASIAFDLIAIERAAPPPKSPAGSVIIVSERGGQSKQKALGFVVGGVGVATLIASGVLMGLAMRQASMIDEPDACIGNLCSPKGLDVVSRAGTLADASQWVGVAGVLVTGVGLTMILTAPPSYEPPLLPSAAPSSRAQTRREGGGWSASASIHPWVGPSGAGITLAGRL